MTKCTNMSNQRPSGKPIEFVRFAVDGVGAPLLTPSCYDEVVLTVHDFEDGLDLIYAFSGDGRIGTLILGRWNNGFVAE